MQDYDSASWSFTKKLLKNLKKIAIVASVRDKYCEIPPSFAKRTLDSNIKSRNSNATESPPSKKTHFDIENLPIEERLESWVQELEESSDPSGFLKIELTGQSDEEIRLYIRKVLHTSEGMVEIQPVREKSSNEIGAMNGEARTSGNKRKENEEMENQSKMIEKFLGTLTMRTEGKALDVFQLLQNMQRQELIKIEGNKLVVTLKMKRLCEMKQFLTVEPPLSRISINGEILDRLETHAYLIMKAAAIIGEEFDLQMLMKVNPFQLSISNEKLRRVLNYLEKSEFIETLDETEHNVMYRFLNPFMREIIYNRMLFSQRRQLHRYVAEAMQNNPFLNEADEKQECDKLIYHWCLAENLDAMSDESENSQFSNKAKRSLIVKKISSLLSKNQHSLSIILKSGYLEKKSDHGMSWSSRFLVLNGKDLKYYYSEADFKKNTDFALGVISLKHIFKIFYLDEKSTKKKFAFVIYTGSWQKKNKEMGVREFYFAANEYSTLETWTTYLEFLRAKAIYDDFVYSFGKISFPLSGNDVMETGFSNSKMNMSRMTQALENNRLSYKSPTLPRKNTLSTTRKMTVMKGLSNKQIVLNTMQEVMASNANQENAKRLKERLFRFFMTSFKLFMSHISEVANSKSNGLVLGQTTQLLRKIPLNIEAYLFEDVKMAGKTNLTDSQDFRKGSLDFNSGDLIASGENNSGKIDISQNNNLPRKSGTEDSMLMGNTTNPSPIMPLNPNNETLIPPNPSIPRNSIDLAKSKLALEMIKEVEESHSMTVSTVNLTKDASSPFHNQDNSCKNNNNMAIIRPSHFAQEEKKKPQEPQINNPVVVQNLHRSTLDDFDSEVFSALPFQRESVKRSTLLTRQELENLQMSLKETYKGSTEEILEQMAPVKLEKVKVSFSEAGRHREINEGRSCEDLVSETVVLSKKPHRQKLTPEDILGTETENYRQIQKNQSTIGFTSRTENQNESRLERLSSRKSSEKSEKPPRELNPEKKITIFEDLPAENLREELLREEKRIPKVLMRKEKKMKEMNKKEEEFMDKLAFRVFQQEKPPKKEVERGNYNYGHINFYKKG